MVALTFPDGARRDYPPNTTGLDIAKGISPSLAKRTVAMALDGKPADLSDPIEHDAKIEFLTRDDPRALELIRHDAAHVLAEAVQTLWPGTQVTIGPVIDNGFYYDFFRNQPFTPEDFDAIEKKMREIIARDKPFTKETWSREQAKKVFRDKGELFKVELVDAIPEDQQIKIYKQGDWFDLCRGPHMTSTGKIGNAFKLLKTAGAYWRGDSKREMLSRIYGTAFAKQEELDAYLKQIEEAEKRDHRRLGREMDLFHFQEEAPGSVFWHPKGWTLFQTLENYIRRRQQTGGYAEVNAPQLINSSLWVASGHMATFRDAMFLVQPREEDDRTFVLKPMNCPGHVQIFKNGLKSYRDLPFKIAEFGKVHRFEPSGALHGLMRVRAFTQDDAHIFITEEQIADEVLKVNDLILSIYADFGFDDVRIKFSDRPEKRIGDDAVWDKAEAALKKALDASGRPWTLNKGEGAFYGPKLEYVLRDAIGRDWQCGTDSGRSQHAGPARRVLYRRAFRQGDARDAASRHVRLAGTLHRHHDRALCRPFAALAVAAAGGGRNHHLGRRRVRPRGDRRRATPGASRRRRSAQRKDQLQGPRAFAGEGAGAARRRQKGSRGAHRLDPAPRQRQAADHAARCGAGGAGAGSGAAGRAASLKGGVIVSRSSR